MNKNKNELTKDDLARLLFENNFRSLYKVIQYRQKQILIGSSMAVYLILKSWMIFTLLYWCQISIFDYFRKPSCLTRKFQMQKLNGLLFACTVGRFIPLPENQRFILDLTKSMNVAERDIPYFVWTRYIDLKRKEIIVTQSNPIIVIGMFLMWICLYLLQIFQAVDLFGRSYLGLAVVTSITILHFILMVLSKSLWVEAPRIAKNYMHL